MVLDQPELDGVPTVGIDDAAGTALATRHLLELGHRRLAVLSTPLRPDGYQGLADGKRQRWAAYLVPARLTTLSVVPNGDDGALPGALPVELP